MAGSAHVRRLRGIVSPGPSGPLSATVHRVARVDHAGPASYSYMGSYGLYAKRPRADEAGGLAP